MLSDCESNEVFGNIVETVGNSLESVGNSVEAAGNTLEAAGNTIEAAGNTVDSVGNTLEAAGNTELKDFSGVKVLENESPLGNVAPSATFCFSSIFRLS